ncbi:MAG: HYR domain-containing protein, partial [Lewinellaceae bacterium]|nr:HYR domain-containing protein [Lewinellaceae bacterium]
MNSSTTPRRLALAVATLMCLFAAQSARAQCEDFVSAPTGPVTINLFLDDAGSVNLTAAVLNANSFVKDAACDYWLSQTPGVLASYANTPISFDCSDAGSQQTWYVRVGGNPLIDDDNGPGATIVELKINIIDNILPLAGASDLGVVTVNTSWGDIAPCNLLPPAPPCAASNVYFAQVCGGVITPVQIAIFGSNAPPSIPNDFQDNCLDSLSITWELSGATTRTETNARGSFITIPPFDASSNFFDASQDTFNVGTTLVTYRIYDDLADPNHLMPVVITATVTVVDDEVPVINCPANQNVNNDMGVCNAVVNYPAATATDNCPGVTIGYSQNAGTAFPVGMTVVTATATDASTNTSTCTFTVTVTDNEPPQITCPADFSVAADPVTCEYVAVGTEFDATYSDNCAISTITNNQPGVGGATLMGTAFVIGMHTIEWEAEDIHGNTATCFFEIDVKDITPPTGPDSGKVIMVNVTMGDCSATVTYEYPGLNIYLSNDCSPVTLSEGPAIVNGDTILTFLDGLLPFDPDKGRMILSGGLPATLTFPVGETKIPYTWSDNMGNDSVEYIIVIVNENVNPTAKCKPGI